MDASSSTAGSGSAPDVAALAPLTVGETCMYMSPSPYTGCRMPRSCQSCLATAGCMIDEVGSCVSTQDEPLDAAKNFRLAQTEGLVLPNATADGVALSAKQTWQFPAGRVKYCSMGDAVCSACASSNFWRSRGSSPDSRYCVGADGSCVCIDVCERRWYVNQDCSARRGSGASLYAPAPTPSGSGVRSPWSSTDSMGDPSMVNRIWQGMVGSIIFVMVVLAFVLWARRKSEVRARQEQEERRRRAQARRERRQTTADQLGVSALNLSGWDAYRRELIEKESAQLASGSETKSVEPAAVQEATSHHDNDDHDHNNSNDDDTHDGRSAAYVRMQEEPPAEAATSVVPTQEETSDDRAPVQRPSATLAPLSVSQTVQPRR